MRISELAQQTGVSIHTLRFYEKIGLIRPEDSTRLPNNYRDYNDKTVERVLFVRKSKVFGFTLREMKRLLVELDNEQLHIESLTALVKEKLVAIDEKMADLEQMRYYLKAKLEQLQSIAATKIGIL